MNTKEYPNTEHKTASIFSCWKAFYSRIWRRIILIVYPICLIAARCIIWIFGSGNFSTFLACEIMALSAIFCIELNLQVYTFSGILSRRLGRSELMKSSLKGITVQRRAFHGDMLRLAVYIGLFYLSGMITSPDIPLLFDFVKCNAYSFYGCFAVCTISFVYISQLCVRHCITVDMSSIAAIPGVIIGAGLTLLTAFLIRPLAIVIAIAGIISLIAFDRIYLKRYTESFSDK